MMCVLLKWNSHVFISIFLPQRFVEESEGISTEEQTLYFGGVPLEDDQNISECLSEGATVDVCVKLLGGKTIWVS